MWHKIRASFHISQVSVRENYLPLINLLACQQVLCNGDVEMKTCINVLVRTEVRVSNFIAIILSIPRIILASRILCIVCSQRCVIGNQSE
jgi:hypothetical protein